MSVPSNLLRSFLLYRFLRFLKNYWVDRRIRFPLISHFNWLKLVSEISIGLRNEKARSKFRSIADVHARSLICTIDVDIGKFSSLIEACLPEAGCVHRAELSAGYLPKSYSTSLHRNWFRPGLHEIYIRELVLHVPPLPDQIMPTHRTTCLINIFVTFNWKHIAGVMDKYLKIDIKPWERRPGLIGILKACLPCNWGNVD